MILLQRPGSEPLQIESLLIDFEGTLAIDRRVHPKTKDKLNLLSKRLKICVLSKEPKEIVETALRKVEAELVCVKEGESSKEKMVCLERLGPERTVAIGQGMDDVEMIERSAFGICVLGKEGTAAKAIEKADLVVTNIVDALDFLLKPLRQRATLSG